MNEWLVAPTATRQFRLGWLGPVAYGVALGAWIAFAGLSLSRAQILVWVVLGLLAFSATSVAGWLRGVLLEWLPFALILAAYDFLRGYADTLLFSAHVRPQLEADRILFAGEVPTVWLQQRLWDGAGSLHWYDFAACVVYLSYFVATYVVAACLWLLDRPLFRRYVATIVVLAAMGFVTYALFPAAPPWLASQYGELAPTTRSVAVIWSEIPISHVNTFFTNGSQYSNPVAAVPSLHAAFTLLITLVLWRRAATWGRVLLAAYPWAMAFALVYTAEHYLVDVLLGWLYAVIAFAVVGRLARVWPRIALARG